METSEDMPKTLQAILVTVSEKILDALHCEKFSLSDLGTVAVTLQRLIDCHGELKLFAEKEGIHGTRVISRDVIDAIQTQLNLL